MNNKVNAGSTPKHRRRKRTSAAVLKILFVIVLLAGVLLCLPIFQLSAVDIGGLNRIPRETVMNAVQEEMGKHMLRVDKQAVEERIRKIAYVAEAAVQTKFPNRLKIDIKETTMVGYIKFTGGFIGIDGTGKVITTEQERNEAIPVVDGVKVKTFVIGEIIAITEAERLKTVLTCLNAIQTNGLTSAVARVDVTNMQEILLQTSGQVIAKCGSQDQLEYKIAMFSSVLPQINLQAPGTVDLRIAGQAIYDVA